MSLDFKKLILEGIQEAHGEPEDIEHIEPESLKSIGHMIARRMAVSHGKFPQYEVSPINSLSDFTKRDCYTSKYELSRGLTPSFEEALRGFKTGNATGVKTVYLVELPNDVIGYYSELVSELASCKMKPCHNGLNYLLGLVEQIPVEELGDVLKGKTLCAAELDNPNSTVRHDIYGMRDQYVKVSVRYDNGKAELSWGNTNRENTGKTVWHDTYLCELI